MEHCTPSKSQWCPSTSGHLYFFIHHGHTDIPHQRSNKKINQTNEEINNIDQAIKDQVKKAVEFSENSPYPDKEDVFSDIYVQKDYPFLKE